MAIKLRRRKRTSHTAPLAQAKLITATVPKITIPQAQISTPAARAAQTDFAGQADGVNTARIMQDKNGNIVGGEFGFGNTVKKYDPKNIAWIMGRGASGGSLSRADKAIYDRMMYLRAQKTAQEQKAAQEQKELDAAHAEDERKRNLDAAEWDRQNAVRNKQAQDMQIAEEQRRNAEYDRRVKAEQDYKAQQAQAKLDAENAKYEALNSKHGLAAGTRLSQKDYDDLEAGRKKYGYSRRDQEAVDKIRSDLDDARRSLIFNSKEWNRVTQEADDAISRFDKRIIDNDNPLTAEQIYNGAFKGPDGTLYVTDGKGGLSPIKGTEPQKEVETPSERNARVAQERKDKWLDDRIKILTSPRKGQVKDKFGNVTESMVDGLSYQDAYDQAQDEMKIRFPEPAPVPQKNTTTGDPYIRVWTSERGYTPPSYGQQDQLNPYVATPSATAHAPQGTGAAPTPTPAQADEIKKKWAQYAD